MSRSALAHASNLTNDKTVLLTAPTTQPITYIAPPIMGNPIIPISAPFMIPQTYAPIPLYGDEDDNDDPYNRKHVVPMSGNETNFNINTLLFNNILESDYFKALITLQTYHEVLDEVRACVKHVEPWQTGTSRLPSSAFCLLLKLLFMKMTYKQMNGILNCEDNCFIRAIGFLYLRYTCPSNDLYKWFEPYLEDDTAFQPCSDKTIEFTVGQYCRKLLTDMQYFGTTFPRIPVLIDRKIKVYLLLLDEKIKRRISNKKYEELGYFCNGTKVQAIYGDEENEPAWYEAKIDMRDDESQEKYWVTFTEYGNQSCVDLGEMKLIDIPKDRERDKNRDREREYNRDRDRDRNRYSRDRDSRDRRSGRRRSRSRSNNKRRSRSPSIDSNESSQNFMEKVLKQSREGSVAVGKNYGHRPISYKGSLSLKLDTFTARKKSPDRGTKYRRRSRSNERNYERVNLDNSSSNTNNTKAKSSDHLKKLKEMYGDASAAN